MTDTYRPTWESLDEHPLPEWYAGAKLGIFVHWGPYSVPAWAPPDAEIGGEDASPYAEWYPYYMYESESPTAEYHREHYGADIEYRDFAAEWHAERWDPEAWADLFADVGARYVLLTAEHHDGFPLWPTHYAPEDASTLGPGRDLVGDLCTAVRDRGLKFGGSYHANLNYHQPGFPGQFGHPDFEGPEPFAEGCGPGREYVDFMDAKHRELIRRYEPDLLWFDTPQAGSDHLRVRELVADYYEGAAERGQPVVVNDRSATDAAGMAGLDGDDPAGFHGDFATPEYRTLEEVAPFKWETCRAIGRSFGYNRAEEPEDHLSGAELVALLADVVSKNGNLLLGVGPRADGTIPDPQRDSLSGLGSWLDDHGEAIFGTRPWAVAEDPRSDADLRYTWREDTLYAVLLDWQGPELRLGIDEHVDPRSVANARLVGAGATVEWRPDDSVLGGPADPPTDAAAHVVALDGVPNPR